MKKARVGCLLAVAIALVGSQIKADGESKSEMGAGEAALAIGVAGGVVATGGYVLGRLHERMNDPQSPPQIASHPESSPPPKQAPATPAKIIREQDEPLTISDAEFEKFMSQLMGPPKKALVPPKKLVREQNEPKTIGDVDFERFMNEILEPPLVPTSEKNEQTIKGTSGVSLFRPS